MSVSKEISHGQPMGDHNLENLNSKGVSKKPHLPYILFLSAIDDFFLSFMYVTILYD